MEKDFVGSVKVRILAGELSEPEDTERKLLKQEEMENGVRLSCLVKTGNRFGDRAYAEGKEASSADRRLYPSFAFDQDIQKNCGEKFKKPNFGRSKHLLRIKILSQIPKASLEMGCLQMREFVPGQVTVVLHGNQVIQIEEGNTTEKMYGVAVDIGTTTVVCTLIDMLTGKGTCTCIHDQRTEAILDWMC